MLLCSLPLLLLWKDALCYIWRILSIRDAGHLQSAMGSQETLIFPIISILLSLGIMGKKGNRTMFFNNLFFLIAKATHVMFLLENVGNLGKHKESIHFKSPITSSSKGIILNVFIHILPVFSLPLLFFLIMESKIHVFYPAFSTKCYVSQAAWSLNVRLRHHFWWLRNIH